MFDRGKLTSEGTRTIVTFDPTRDEHPEGVAFDARGRMFLSIAPRGEIRVIESDGSQRSFASITPGSGWYAILGLAFDKAGRLYAAVPSDANPGVWRFSPEGAGELIPGTEGITFANAVTFDQRGAMYVTDSLQGSIWRALPGQKAALWLRAPELEGLAVLGPHPLGANGIVGLRDAVYVANTEKKQVVAVAVLPDGSPGDITVVTAFTGEMEFLDGIAADVFGNLYVVVAGTSTIVRIGPDGSSESIADARDGLSIPASACFGTRGRAATELYVTSLSPPEFVADPTPNVVAVPT